MRRFAPLTDGERRAMDESPDIATALDVNGIAFHLTGDTFTINRDTTHVATIARRCKTDDLDRLHGATVPGIGRVAAVERFVTAEQHPGMSIGLVVRDAPLMPCARCGCDLMPHDHIVTDERGVVCLPCSRQP